MNRNVIKWLLIAAVIAGAAAYLILDNGKGGKEEPHETVLVMDRGPLVKSDPATFTGNSKAFDIEPMEGIRISAAPNALDSDRTFKVREATPAEWKKAEEAVAHAAATPFLVLDIDAGMGQQEILPGVYHVDIDLEELGVPENLWDRIGVFRVVGEGDDESVFQYNTRVDENGVLRYESNQNSLTVIAVTAVATVVTVGGTVGCAAGLLFKWYLLGKGVVPAVKLLVQLDVREYFKEEKDRMLVPWDDPNGDFTVYFRWRDMGDPKAMQDYLELEDVVFQRLDAIKEEAHEEYERRINAIATGKANLSWWERWKNKASRDKARENLLEESVFEEYRAIDSQLDALQNDPRGQLPEPVRQTIEMVKKANAYLNGPAGVRPLGYRLEVYMMNRAEMGGINGKNTKVPGGPCYIKFGFENGMVDGKWSDTPGAAQSVLLTLVHELFHARQQSVYGHINMGMNTAESTAAVLESDAARWFYRNTGDISVDIDFPQGSQAVELTPRTLYYIYGRPLGHMFATSSLKLDEFTTWEGISTSLLSDWKEIGADTGYTLASVIETVREVAGKQNVGMVAFCEKYIELEPFGSLLKRALDIDDATLEKGWNVFIDRYIGSIAGSQMTLEQNDALKIQRDCYMLELLFDDWHPIQKIRAGWLEDLHHYDFLNNFYVRTWFLSTFRNYNKKFSAFIVPVGERINPHIRFYMKGSGFKDGKESPTLYSAGSGSHFLAMSVGNYQVPASEDDQEYWVIALFEPSPVEIIQAKDNQLAIKLPMPTEEIMSTHYISGAVLTYTDKNGQNKLTRDVNPSEFGKTIVWNVPGSTEPENGFTITMHWYYKPDEATTYDSPESDPVKYNVKKDPNKETRNKDLSKPHWKMISREVEKIETEFDPALAMATDVLSVSFSTSEFNGIYDFKGTSSFANRIEEGEKKGQILRDKNKNVVYTHENVLSGAIAYTEPPRYWFPKEEYQVKWNVYNDPYIKPNGMQYTFATENTSSVPADCKKGAEKKQQGESKVAKGATWLSSVSTTFTAQEPGKNDPKHFTFTQEYSISDPVNPDRVARFQLVYVYVWTGEDEVITETEGPGLEGGYWRLVRTEVDDSKAKQKAGGRVAGNREDNDNGWVSGSNGSYSCFVEWWAWTDWVQERGGRRATNYRVVDTWVRNIDITVPKQQYKPGEAIAFDVTNGPVSIEGDGDRALEHLPSGNVYAYFRSKNGEYDTVHGFVSSGKSAWDEDNPSYNTGQVVWTYSGVLPEEKYVDDNNYWGFVIIHGVKAPYGRMEVKYHYEWVPRQAAPKKAGHWHLSSTYVNTARTGSSSMSGQKGKYTVNGRSIRFDVPKTDYQPGEQVSLRIVHGKMKKSSGEYPWGEGNMSTVQLGECTSISGSLNPRYDAGEAVCVYQGVTPLEGSPGDVGFWIEEKVNNGEDFLTTDYYYEWVDD